MSDQKMKLKNILESINNSPIDILYNGYIEYLRKKFGITRKISLKRKNLKGNSFGHFDNTNTITIDKDRGVSIALVDIGHEMVHVKQVEHGDLIIAAQSITWKGTEYSLQKYVKNKDYSIHAKWPWEKEAYEKQKILKNDFLQSNEYDEIMNSNPTLKYMKQHDLI